MLLRPRLASLCCALALLAGAAACAPPNEAIPYPDTEPPLGEARPTGTVRYFDRAIDLEPFLVGFPYGEFRAELAEDRLFFLEHGDRYTLRALRLTGAGAPLDLGAAAAVGDVDWSTRSLWDLHLPRGSNTLWLHADASNDERMNLWTLDLEGGALAQVTDFDYLYGFGFSADDALVAYLARTGAHAPYRTCLRLRTIASGEEREVVCDTPSLTFTWSSPRFGAGGREVYFNALGGGDRNREQIVAVDLTAAKPSARVITEAGVTRSSAFVLRGLVDDQLLFVANDDGYANLFAYAPKTREVRQLTRLREDIVDARIVDAGVFAIHRTPLGSTLVVVDPRSGKILGQQRVPGTASLIDGEGERVLWSQESPDLLFEANLSRVTPTPGGGAPGLQNQRLITVGDDLANKVVHCKAEAVKIPTFDTDPATGRRRELHAYVLRPRAPLAEPARRLALIRAFYGGENLYSAFDQVMCAAGLTVISPSVRGSDGFGKAFAALNDRDLGGAEIVDVFEVARWAQATMGLTPAQIGVFGGSHGGYAVMRALTYQDAPERFPLGFGMAHAGFSDVLTFFRATNIPDWVLLEAGDPATPEGLARIQDRSPLGHVDRLRAPLLLTHGERDARVPVAESRQLAARAKAMGKPVTYVEFPGQGHGIEGLARQVELYQARFDLLTEVVRGAEPEVGASAPAVKPAGAPAGTGAPAGAPAGTGARPRPAPGP
ncbi:MAG: prolyl oligopeptidase family serine peptidase [Nannocystaceae bacterium]